MTEEEIEENFEETRNSLYNWNREGKTHMTIDVLENAVDSLETIIHFFNREDNLKWKWIIICIHHALYSFCICNLQGTNYEQVLIRNFDDDNNQWFKRGEEKWKKSKKIKRGKKGYIIEWNEHEFEPIFNNNGKVHQVKRKEKLISFWTAIARVQDQEFWMARYIHSRHVIITDEQIKALESIEYLRDEFIHYVPKLHSIEIGYMCENILKILPILNNLAFNTNQVSYYLDKHKQDRIKNSLDMIEKVLKQLI
ncbi:MAG TPA: hypothetical protein VHP32_06775 [Ignavibacteria bacterium]|nr:hypothetical protein [Ignavibacteria bacterium]